MMRDLIPYVGSQVNQMVSFMDLNSKLSVKSNLDIMLNNQLYKKLELIEFMFNTNIMFLKGKCKVLKFCVEHNIMSEEEDLITSLGRHCKETWRV